jgi:dTDP-4-dehydrorhamnose reductase
MRILITGGSGFIGRHLAEQLAGTYEVSAPSSAELDLLNEQKVREYLDARRFDVIVHTATTVCPLPRISSTATAVCFSIWCATRDDSEK